MPSSRILITHARVITQNPVLGTLADADVLIVDDKIVQIGSGIRADRADVIDATGMTVMPGMIDSHRHMWQGAIAGSGAKVSLSGYFGVVLSGLLDKYRPQDVYDGVLWSSLQAINAGVTTVADWSHIVTTPEHADENVRALQDSGIRAVFLYGPPVGQGLEKWFFESVEAHPADARRMRAEVLSDDDARVTMGIAARGPEFSVPRVVGQDLRLARDLDVVASMHSGLPGYVSKYKTIATLDELGVLGEGVHHAHGAQFSDADLARIAATGGAISPCPTVDMQMAMATFPATGRALDHGITTGLGTDTNSGTGTDLFSEMRIALSAERARTNKAALDRDEPPQTVEHDAQSMLDTVTTQSAKIWRHQDRTGSLMIGGKADLIIVDTTRPQFVPINDPVTSIVLNAGASDVDTVIVDGVIRKRDGRLTGDLETAAERLEASRRFVFDAADLADILGQSFTV